MLVDVKDRRRWIEMAGFAGACLFAFGAWAGIALANVGTTLMLFAGAATTFALHPRTSP